MNNIVRNSFSLLFAEGVRLLLAFVVLVVAARELGAFGYGQFSYAYALGAILGMFATLGLPNVLTRELAQRREEDLFSPLLSLQMALGGLVLGVVGGVAALLLWGSDSVVATALLLLLVFFFAQAIFYSVAAFFHARQRMEQEGLIRVGMAFLLLVVGLAVLQASPGVQQLAGGYALAGILAMAGMLFVFHVYVRHLRFSVNWPLWKEFLSLSWPVGLTLVFGSVLGHVDSVMLGLFGQVTETGWYNAGYRIAALAAVPASLIGTAFFPVLSQRMVSSRDLLRVLFAKYLAVMAVIALSLSVAGVLLAPFVIGLFYGEEFAPAAPALQILFGMVFMQFFYLSFFFLLLAANRVRALLLVAGAGVAGNILLNGLLIPAFSLYGAAIASVLSYAFMAGATGFLSWKKVLATA